MNPGNQIKMNRVLFTYENGSNDLKVQSKKNGGLNELQDKFSDGRRRLDSESLEQTVIVNAL